jgi:hypothetical protein
LSDNVVAARGPVGRREVLVGAGAAAVMAVGTVAAARSHAAGESQERLASPAILPVGSPQTDQAVAADAPATTAVADAVTQAGGRAALSAEAVTLHLARRLTFGPTPALLADIAGQGPDAWFASQLNPQSIDDSELDRRLAEMSPLALDLGVLVPGADQLVDGLGLAPLLGSVNQALDDVSMLLRSVEMELTPKNRQLFATMLAELRFATVLRAVYSRRQVYEQLVDFWSNHFNVSPAGSPLLPGYVAASDRDVIRPQALGRFADMLQASAASPAMLVYLDNWTSRRDNPNENYGRELLELHTVGLGAGFTEADVRNATRVFTGWTVDLGQGTFSFEPGWHDPDPKQVLGWSTAGASGPAGQQEGTSLLAYLARHPATASHLASKLLTRFVADAPPPELVASTADVYLANDTAIAPTLAHIFSSDAFWDSYGGKLRRPYDFFIGALRATGAELDASPRSDGARGAVDGTLAALGQRLFDAAPPTGYPERATAWLGAGLLPRWSAGALLARDALPGITVDRTGLVSGQPTTAGALVDQLLQRLYGGGVDPDRRGALLSAIQLADAAPMQQSTVTNVLPVLVEFALAAREGHVR